MYVCMYIYVQVYAYASRCNYMQVGELGIIHRPVCVCVRACHLHFSSKLLRNCSILGQDHSKEKLHFTPITTCIMYHLEVLPLPCSSLVMVIIIISYLVAQPIGVDVLQVRHLRQLAELPGKLIVKYHRQ